MRPIFISDMGQHLLAHVRIFYLIVNFFLLVLFVQCFISTECVCNQFPILGEIQASLSKVCHLSVMSFYLCWNVMWLLSCIIIDTEKVVGAC
jgi:hypothetical protein